MTNIIDLLHLKMAEHNIICKESTIQDGEIHRFANDDEGNENCWYVLYDHGGAFGDWKTGVKEKFGCLNSCQQNSYNSVEKLFDLKHESQEKSAQEALKIIKNSHMTNNSLYLENKAINNYDVLYYQNAIIVPLQDIDGQVWSLQRIFDDGKKKLLKGGKKQGCFHLLGALENASKIYVCEGYATGISIYLATNKTVVVAIDAYNISSVIAEFRGKYPALEIIVCADNDIYSEINVGKVEAEKVAHDYGCKVILPTFKDTSNNPTDFNDLHQDQGLEAVKKQILTADYVLQGTNIWDKITPLEHYEATEISIDYLPNNLQQYAKELAIMAEIDSTAVVMGCLAILSTILSTKFVVSPKPDWNEAINIYTLIALPPANNKTLVMKNLLAPIVKYEQKLKEEMIPKIATQKSQRLNEEKVIEKLRKDLVKNIDSDQYNLLNNQIIERESQLTKVDKMPKFFANNLTTESLIDEIDNSDGKFAIIADEGGVFETLSGLYSNGKANIDVLLNGIDGGHVRVKRKTHETSINPYLTMFLMVQPKIIENISNKHLFSGVGLLERFLYAIPKSYLGSRKHEDHYIEEVTKQSYHDLLTSFLEDMTNLKEVNILQLSAEAKTIWKEFQLGIEQELGNNGRLEHFRGWGGKISGFALRIAGLIHVCDYYLKDNSLIIGKVEMEKSLAICRALIMHAKYVFQDNNQGDLEQLLKWIYSIDDNYFTQSNLTLKFRNNKIRYNIDDLISVLIEYNYLKKEIKNTKGKPVIYYHINPKLSQTT